MKTIHIFGWGRPRDGGEVERDPEPCSLGCLTTSTECDFEGPIAKSVQWAQNSYQQHWEQSRFQAHLQFITLCNSSFLTVTRLKWFSPHGGGRFSIGFSQTIPSSPGHRWCLQCPMSGLYLPYQKNVSKIFSLKSIIHYDVDENLWPNPQDRVKTNIEVQWGTL